MQKLLKSYWADVLFKGEFPHCDCNWQQPWKSLLVLSYNNERVIFRERAALILVQVPVHRERALLVCGSNEVDKR